MPQLQITAPQLPNAVFFSRESLLANIDEAMRYEAAVAEFSNDGNDLALYEALSALGFNVDEIAWHTERPGKRMAQGYL